MRKKCVFGGEIVDYHRTGHVQLWPFYFRSTQCNEGDHSELLQPLCNTQMAVCLPQHTVPTMHLSLSPVWISLMRRLTPRLVKNKEIFFLPREKVGTVLAIPSAQPKHNQQNRPEVLQA